MHHVLEGRHRAGDPGVTKPEPDPGEDREGRRDDGAASVRPQPADQPPDDVPAIESML